MIFLDGALGSILLDRANKSSSGLWSAQFLLDDPEAIKSLYEEYIGIGSDLITTNTYSTIPSYLNKEKISAKMPELVAFMHSMVGLAAVFIAIAAVLEPYALNITEKGQLIPAGNRLELFLGAAIGAITFSGSVIAFGKLSGSYKFRLFQGSPIVFKGQHFLNLILRKVQCPELSINHLA